MTELNNLIENISNIKNDITNAMIEKGASFTNFASYPGAIENIVTGGGAYQYDSLENMYNDVPNRSDGDIGVVYSNSMSNPNPGDTISVIFLPDKVVFDTPISGTYSLQLRKSMIRFSCTINSTGFQILDQSMPTIIGKRVFYSSTDGITYIRTHDSSTYDGDSIDFGTEITLSSTANLNILKFFTSRSIIFDGVFKHNGSNFNIVTDGLNAGLEQVWNNKFYGLNGIQNGNLSQNINLNLAQLKSRANLYSKLSNLSLKDGITDINEIFSNMINLKVFPIIDTSKIKTMHNTFFSCKNMTSVPGFNFSNVSDMSETFYGCSNLTDLSNLDTSNVINMSRTFMSCTSLTEVDNLDVSNVVDMSSTFSYCSNLTSISNFDTSNVTSMNGIFFQCTNLTNSPNLDTSNVSNMGYMFYGCNNLVECFNYITVNAKTFYSMFKNCHNLTTVPNFNSSNVTNMRDMFENCHNLTAVPDFDTSNVTDVSNMFQNCNRLTAVPNFNMINVTNTWGMFCYCNNLTIVSDFNLPNVTDMQSMFFGCQNLASVSNINTSEVNTISRMFSMCNNLTTVTQFNTSKVAYMETAFSYCNKLSNASIQNIINMCLNSNVPNGDHKNLSISCRYSPFNYTKFNSSYYSNRLSELSSVGWTY